MKTKKISIVIIESSPLDLLTKFSKALREKGYKTSLISLLGNLETPFFKKSYDERISFDFKFFKINYKEMPKIFSYSLKKFPSIYKAVIKILFLNPDIIIVRANPNWLPALAKNLFRKSLFIYFPYDFRSLCYNSYEEMIKYVPHFEIKSERYCFENADGIMYKGAENKFDYLDEKILGKNLKITAPKFHIVPYCSKNLVVPPNKDKLSKKDKEIHIVFAGNMDPHPTCLNTFNMVIKQKIHLHVYGKTANIYSDESDRIKAHAKFFKSKYFHLHKQLEQEELIKEISKYDYGLWPGYYGKEYSTNKMILYETGNKFSTYFEACLPIIYIDNYKYIGESIQRYGAGIPITITTPLKKVLKKQNYKKLVNKIIKGRKEIILEEQIPRLEKFFKETLIYKNTK